MASLQEELEAVKAEFQRTKMAIVKHQADFDTSVQYLKKEANDLSLERDQYVKLAAERLTLTKFGLERFSTDNDLIKFYTGFLTYKHIIFCMNL